jgi:hypothetical protein
MVQYCFIYNHINESNEYTMKMMICDERKIPAGLLMYRREDCACACDRDRRRR